MSAKGAAPGDFGISRGSDARSLGLALAKIYGERTERGLKHAKDYYTELLPEGLPYGLSLMACALFERLFEISLRLPPISCTNEQWQKLAALAEQGARLCCPTAAAFFDGLKEGLGAALKRLGGLPDRLGCLRDDVGLRG